MNIASHKRGTAAIIVLVAVGILSILYASNSYSSSGYGASTTSGLVAKTPLGPPNQVLIANTTIIGTTPVFTAANEAVAPEQNPAVGNNYASCTSKQNNETAQCYGELYQESSGCVMLIVPVMDPNNNPIIVNQYYALHNLPASHPPVGSWVTITGQISQSQSGSSNQSCPLSSINVTKVS